MYTIKIISKLLSAVEPHLTDTQPAATGAH